MRRLSVLLIVLLVIAAGIYTWWNNGITAVDPNDKSSKIFLVQQGKGVRELANQLKKEGLIKDPVVFFILVKKLGLDGKIQAGDFRLSSSMTATEIAQNLTHGTLDIWVTIPEGKRADEIADILQAKIPSYDEFWRVRLDANEGYLFPDTYLIPKDADVDMVIQIMTNNFYTKLDSIGLSKDTAQLAKIVTIASLIEREAKGNVEKPIIAGIIKNRLDDGMALQIDATIQYAKGKRDNSWWAPVKQEEYKSVQSTYNTYLYPGLPPGPIANPGIDALSAAAEPADTPYVYYLHDKNGVIRYASSYEDHLANQKKYGL